MKKSDVKSPPAKDVDEYLAGVPNEARATLAKLRKTIKAAAPMASEVISYQMPMYKHHGMVVGFAAFKDHLQYFPRFGRYGRVQGGTQALRHVERHYPFPGKQAASRSAREEARQGANRRERGTREQEEVVCALSGH